MIVVNNLSGDNSIDVKDDNLSKHMIIDGHMRQQSHMRQQMEEEFQNRKFQNLINEMINKKEI